MPVCVEKRGKVWRCVDCDTRKIVRNRAGTAVDGGGFRSETGARRQQKAINTSLHMAHKI